MYPNACNVVIEGLPPGILMHNPAGAAHFNADSKKSVRSTIPTIEDEAAASAYWNEDKSSLAWPGFNFYRGLVEAAGGCKLPSNKKLALRPVIAGDLLVEPFWIPFGTTEYKVHTCRAVIQRAGVLRARAWLPEWSLTFTVSWEAQLLGNDFDDQLRELLDRLGHSIGIGDFRPGKGKGGPFGKFVVKEMKHL